MSLESEIAEKRLEKTNWLLGILVGILISIFVETSLDLAGRNPLTGIIMWFLSLFAILVIYYLYKKGNAVPDYFQFTATFEPKVPFEILTNGMQTFIKQELQEQGEKRTKFTEERKLVGWIKGFRTYVLSHGRPIPISEMAFHLYKKDNCVVFQINNSDFGDKVITAVNKALDKCCYHKYIKKNYTKSDIVQFRRSMWSPFGKPKEMN